ALVAALPNRRTTRFRFSERAAFCNPAWLGFPERRRRQHRRFPPAPPCVIDAHSTKTKEKLLSQAEKRNRHKCQHENQPIGTSFGECCGRAT
ncbi:MAG: hypothetical protein P4L80_12290, partial [Xanthobacteraceae bacterium]|nr:hypothetical protein [Xanthobacteraceae bacterium]